MALYTPFFQRAAQGVAGAYGQRRTNELTQSAYMGDPRAFQELSRIDPNAANQVRQQKMQEEQIQLQQAAQRQQIQANQQQMRQQTQQWAVQNRELVQGIMQKAAQMPDFNSAQQFLASEIEGLKQSGVQIPQGMSAQTFTPEVYEQIKKAFPQAAPAAVSPLGKLAQDFRNGIIPQEAFEAEVAKLGEDPTEAYIRGLEAQKAELELEKTRRDMQADEARTAQTAQQQAAQQVALVDQANTVANFIKQAYDLVDTTQSGYTGAALATVSPSGQNAEFRRKLESIKANIGFDKLMEMKRSSPTGGALGAISVQELQSLQSSLGSLDAKSSDGEIKNVLNGIYDVYQRLNRGAGGQGLPPLAPMGLEDMSSDDLVNMLGGGSR